MPSRHPSPHPSRHPHPHLPPSRSPTRSCRPRYRHPRPSPSRPRHPDPRHHVRARAEPLRPPRHHPRQAGAPREPATRTGGWTSRRPPAPGLGPGRRGRHRLRAHRRRRASSGPDARRDTCRGDGVLHPALRRPGVRGRPAREADRGRARSARTRRRRRSSRCGAPCTAPRRSATSTGSRRGSARCPARSASSATSAARSAPARSEEAKVEKERIADEAERLSQGTDWRNGANRMRQLLDEWKALPRLEKSVDDGLWHRFSTARTTYTRRRKSHFAELNEKRDSARVVKEKLVVEAEAIAILDRVGPDCREVPRPDAPVEGRRTGTQGGRRPAVEEVPWRAGRVLRQARDSASAELDAEFAANAEKKEALLVEAEALRPGDATSGRPRRRSATSPSGGTPPARSPASG